MAPPSYMSTKSRVPSVDARKVRGKAVVSMWSERRKRFYTKVPEAIRFWSKVHKTPTCWIWIAGKQGTYGTFNGNTAHSWIAKNVMKVKVTHKMVIDHACRNPLCVRPHPKHVRYVSQRVNLTNGPNPIGQAILQTHCKYGHPLSGNNLYICPSDGGRVCRECHNRRAREYFQRKRQKENTCD